jgi:hypothetical protein
VEGLGDAVGAAEAQSLDIFGDSRNDFLIILGRHGFDVLRHGFSPWVVLVGWLWKLPVQAANLLGRLG